VIDNKNFWLFSRFLR